MSLAKILASVLSRALPLGSAHGWTEFINPRDAAVLSTEATCDLVNLYPAAARGAGSHSEHS